MTVRFKGTELRPVLAEAVANQCRIILVKDQGVYFLAERGERLLGTCTLHLIEHLAHDFARSAILEDMVVDRHARGQGVGRELIGRAVERARSWGCYKLALSSHQDRETAQRFYAALGFTSHGVSLALHLG